MNLIFKQALKKYRFPYLGYVLAAIPQYVNFAFYTILYQRLIDQIGVIDSFSEIIPTLAWYAGSGFLMYTIPYVLEYPYRILEHGLYQWTKVFAMKKIARIDYQAYQNIGTGNLIQLIDNGAVATKEILFGFYTQVFRDLIPSTVAGLIMIGVYDRTILIFVFSSYLIVFAMAFFLLNYLRDRKEKILIHEEEFLFRTVRAFMELVVFRLNRRFKREIDRTDHVSDVIVKSKAQMRMIHELFFTVYAFITFALVLGILYYQIQQIIAGNSSVGVMLALIAFVNQVYSPIAIFVVIFVDYKMNRVTFDRFNQFLNLKDDANFDQTMPFEMREGTISFEQVDFQYEQRKLLDGFSLTLDGGKATALVGSTGSGKSTIAKLIVMLLKPDGGKLLVDGQDVSLVGLDDYYEQIAYLPQDAPIFDGTIRENLVFDSRVSEADIWAILRQVKLDEMVRALPDGLETQIGERGIKLSGGEKQRLAFGRVFFQNPAILVLDEPTSALDSLTEEFVTQNLYELFAGKTLVVIAHRLQTVRNADRILVVEDGRISQEGAFRDLVIEDGPFKALWESQTNLEVH
ncbi:MAG: ABC transporter ATP-binding protein [Anaerolineaceae bacterium]|nr:ABC transporter ATP-binding protein [Anaerolineaceae bacterium]